VGSCVRIGFRDLSGREIRARPDKADEMTPLAVLKALIGRDLYDQWFNQRHLYVATAKATGASCR